VSKKHSYLWCWFVLIAVNLADFMPVPIHPPILTYVTNSLTDFGAILLLMFASVKLKTVVYLMYSYIAYIMTHILGGLANTAGIESIYNMYPKALIAILIVQLMILSAGYGNFKRLLGGNNRRYDDDYDVVSQSDFSVKHKKRAEEV